MNFYEKIKSFGQIIFYNNKYTLRECPNNVEQQRQFSLSGTNKTILIKTGTNGYYCGTICENELDKSIEEHKWKIKILKSNNNDIMVGLATSDYNFHSMNHEKCGWYFNIRDSKLYSGPPFNYSGLKTNLRVVKDELVVVMNMKRRTLKFIINNEDKGDSYTNIPIDKPLFPAISIAGKDNSVEISEID